MSQLVNREKGNPREALNTLQLIHDTNHAARNESDHKLVADMSAEPQPIDPGLTEISRSTDSFAQRIGVRLVTAVDEILTGTKFIAEVNFPAILNLARIL